MFLFEGLIVVIRFHVSILKKGIDSRFRNAGVLGPRAVISFSNEMRATHTRSSVDEIQGKTMLVFCRSLNLFPDGKGKS